jgi:hypothetical protein
MVAAPPPYTTGEKSGAGLTSAGSIKKAPPPPPPMKRAASNVPPAEYCVALFDFAAQVGAIPGVQSCSTSESQLTFQHETRYFFLFRLKAISASPLETGFRSSNVANLRMTGGQERFMVRQVPSPEATPSSNKAHAETDKDDRRGASDIWGITSGVGVPSSLWVLVVDFLFHFAIL